MPLITETAFARLGKAQGIILCNMVIFVTICGMRMGDSLTGPEFVSTFSMWISLFMGGSALAAFRDWKKNGTAP